MINMDESIMASSEKLSTKVLSKQLFKNVNAGLTVSLISLHFEINV